MSDKERMVVLDIDLACHRCNKKIKKVLDKYQEKWDIKSIGFDTANNEVRLLGPFDPDKLVKRLCKKACDVIREWCIVAPKPPAPPTKPPPKPEPPKADPPKKDPPKADPPKKDPPKADPPKPDPPKKDPPPKPDPPKKDPPAPKKDPPPKPEANCHPFPFPYPYPYPIPFYYPGGGCDGHKKPCSCGGCDGHNKPCSCGGCDGHKKPCSCGGTCGGHRPCACGCGGGCSGAYQQQPTYVDYGRPCQWVCEEEPAGPCTIM